MFEHSIKVPRHFKIAANIIKKVSTEGGSVKSLLYDNKLRHFKTNVLYALITETIKHANDIDKIFENCGVLKNEPRLDPWVAKVLTTELLFGKKTLPGKSKPEQTILSYKDQFEQYRNDHEDDLKVEVVRRPRYVRINTNLLTTSDAIRAFQDEGYRFIRCTSGSYDDYLKQIQSLTEEDFTQDYHVKTVFVFAAGTKMHEHPFYLENKIILQDKATTLAVHLLAPPAGSVVLDMCAAPGMKTTQLAAYMKNQGKVYAIERNEKRYQTLCEFVEKTESICVKAINKDSLEIKRGDYDDVEYIILDPSCSGSGMELSVHNYIDANRLAKLTSLQEKFLKHAMNSFPNAKKIVYSTCSLYPEENERVVTNVVKTSRAKWRVLDAKELMKGNWNNFGSGMYGSMGYRCLYARLDSDLTTGFFLAVLERDQKDFEKQQQRIENTATENTNEDEESVPKKQKKKKKHEAIDETIVNFNENEVEDDAGDTKKKNKTQKQMKDENEEIVEEEGVENNDNALKLHKKKKKKKSKESNDTEIDPNEIEEKKYEEIKNENEEIVEGESIENNINITKSHKKKNKKKSKKSHDIEIDTNEIEPDDSNKTKSIEARIKKKKNKDKDKEEENINSDEHEIKVKSKKRKHQDTEIENESMNVKKNKSKL